MNNKYEELVEKLKEIFQLDKPELDFGIYRILHARSKEINDFLENRLKTKVQETLKAHGAADAQGALEAARQTVVNTLGSAAIAADSSLNPAFAGTPAGQQYVAAKAAFDAAQGSLKNESEVYSHLLDFFKCYYEGGDFVSKRRYKEGKYAIPYAGEEVKLYWANADQYYTKSGENFTNYSFTVDGLSVTFRLLTAETAKDNVKDNDGERRFVLWDPDKKEPLCSEIVSAVADEESSFLESLPDKFLEEKDGKLLIYFQYLKLPKAKKGAEEKTDQKSLCAAAVVKIKAALAANSALALKYHKLIEAVSKDDKRLLIEKQLADYTAKNTSDYFIHKDLKGFLTRELDFYVKNEMMHLDRIDEAQTIKDIEANLRIIQAFRAIALVLIDFMAQLEEFQKKLYLKKKFVTECEYCITMDRVPEELRAEVLANPKQLAEWEALGTNVDPKTKHTTAIDARMVDTRNFRQPDGSNPFKDKLLKQIDNLDDACDGLLIHADNFQALRFLENRELGLTGIHIDPPYNTDTSGFLYKNDYRHSSWLSMIADRFAASRRLWGKETAFMCHIDENEYERLNVLLDDTGLTDPGTIIWDKRNPMTGGGGIAKQHEYIVCRMNYSGQLLARSDNAKRMLKMVAALIKKAGNKVTDEVREEYKKFLKDDKKLTGGERAYSYIDEQGQVYSSVSLRAPEPRADEKFHKPLCHPVTKKPCPVPPNGFSRTPETLQGMIARGEILFGKDEKTQPRQKRLLTPYSMIQLSSVIIESKKGTSDLKPMGLKFPYCHAVCFYDSLVSAVCPEKNGVVLDYFGGSGTTAHAVIDLDRKDMEDGKEPNRKYILVEMGDHFETVLKPRIKKVVYSPDWKDGKPMLHDKGISHCFKYLSLESYEDTLNNLELTRTAQQQEMMAFGGDEYLLKYMLDLESRGSVISTDDFRKPFEYRLKIAYESSGATKEQKIDLVETFNYLIGLKVKQRIAAYQDGYVYVTGTLPNGESAIVFWRDCDVIDADKLNAELAKIADDPSKKAATFDVVYVNGDHAVQNAAVKSVDGVPQLKVRQIENEFLEKMFEEAK